MKNSNSIEKIKKEEKEAEEKINQAKDLQAKKVEVIRAKYEEKLANISQEISEEIKDIYKEAEDKIEEMKNISKKEIAKQSEKIKSLSPAKKDKGADLIIDKIS
ncbi:MAG: hypothetical protein U5L76_02985 [Patescibacteria group bacterium]|nr:hypothetical protein [Patescibacteria group bacterium]